MIRIYLTADLEGGQPIQLSPEQTHYLFNVMRLAGGDELLVFNGRDGEWRARVANVGRREGSLETLELSRPQQAPPDLELAAALVKRTRLETIVEKAAELGARRVRLVVTERTNVGGANVQRLAAIAVEAAEQTGRLDVPQISAPVSLGGLLEDWEADRAMMFCDEAGDAPPVLKGLEGRPAGPWGVLIGPEGGFSESERRLVRGRPGTVAVSLGPRVMRADTAAVAALTLWQAALGDLRGA